MSTWQYVRSPNMTIVPATCLSIAEHSTRRNGPCKTGQLQLHIIDRDQPTYLHQGHSHRSLARAHSMGMRSHSPKPVLDEWDGGDWQDYHRMHIFQHTQAAQTAGCKLLLHTYFSRMSGCRSDCTHDRISARTILDAIPGCAMSSTGKRPGHWIPNNIDPV
jgi:hypothetical protein